MVLPPMGGGGLILLLTSRGPRFRDCLRPQNTLNRQWSLRSSLLQLRCMGNSLKVKTTGFFFFTKTTRVFSKTKLRFDHSPERFTVLVWGICEREKTVKWKKKEEKSQYADIAVTPNKISRLVEMVFAIFTNSAPTTLFSSTVSKYYTTAPRCLQRSIKFSLSSSANFFFVFHYFLLRCIFYWKKF